MTYELIMRIVFRFEIKTNFI